MKLANLITNLGVAVGLFAMTQSAQAAVTTYTDLTAWEAAVASYTTEDFNDPLLQNRPVNTIPAGSYTGPLTSITSFGQPAIVTGNRLFDTLDMNGAVDTAFSFNPGVFGIGGDWNEALFGGQGTGIRVTTAGGTQDIAVVDLVNPDPLGFAFWGFTIDEMIMSVELIEDIALLGQETYLLDNLRMATALAQVPEPAILALLGLGLVGIGFSRRKRRT